MTGPIICGVDGSASARGAAHVARSLGDRLGLRLVFVGVVEDGAPEHAIEAVAGRLERLSSPTDMVHGDAGWLVGVGHPADRIVAAATAEQASLIVVGSTGPRSSLLGSISAEVSRRAPCPVVVVPPGADAIVGGDRPFDDRVAGGIARIGLGRGASSNVEAPAIADAFGTVDVAGDVVRSRPVDR